MHVALATLALSALAMAAPAAVAQPAWPTKTVRIVAAFAPGSTLDIMGRLIAPRLAEALGQQVIVENRVGAGGMIGMDAIAKSAPDGHTLGIGALGPNATNPALYPKTPFDAVKDFAGVGQIATGPVAIVIHPSVPARNVKELVALGRSRSGQLNYGTPGVGTSPHLAGELFQIVTGAKFVHVPYKGNPEALNDLIGGQLSIVFSGTPPVVPFVQSKRLRAIALTGKQRLPSLPEAQPIGEAGFPGAEVLIWYGVIAPAGTPREVLSRLNTEIGRIMRLPEIRDRFVALGADPALSTPEEFSALIRDEFLRWQKVIRQANIKVE